MEAAFGALALAFVFAAVGWAIGRRLQRRKYRDGRIQQQKVVMFACYGTAIAWSLVAIIRAATA